MKIPCVLMIIVVLITNIFSQADAGFLLDETKTKQTKTKQSKERSPSYAALRAEENEADQFIEVV